MKFEVKTENDNFSKPFYPLSLLILSFLLIVILLNISLKLGNISRFYQIDYLCKLLSVEKSPSNFKKLSKISKQTNKQKIWDFCRDIIK
tara:strand:- start:162 stop:428 length:267 start_codon:yes stop_codon:yes gene_type:complete